MVWVVDKKTVRHLLERDGKLLEIPVRVKFEYEYKEGNLVPGTIRTEKLYNRQGVVKRFPDIDVDELDEQIQKSVDRDVRDHIALH